MKSIAPFTRSQEPQLAEQVESTDVLMRGRTRGSRSVGINLNNKNNRPQERDKNNETKDDQPMEVMEQAGRPRVKLRASQIKAELIGKASSCTKPSGFLGG